MSSGYAGTYVSARAVEQAARQARQASIAALRAEHAALRRQASALGRLADGWRASAGTRAPSIAATSAELAIIEQQLRADIDRERRDLDRLVREAWDSAVRDSLAAIPEALSRPAKRSGRPAPGATGRQRAALDRQDQEAAAADQRSRASDEVTKARQAMAEHISHCHPDDIERLRRIALGLGEADVVAAQALKQSVAESVARQRQAERSAMDRERLRTLAADALPEERPTLLQLVDNAPDSGLPGLEERIDQAAARAVRARARAGVARAAVAALQEIGCDVGPEFGTFLSAANAAIAPMPAFPGYGLRVRLSASSIETLVVRQQGSDGASGGAAQRAVCARMDSAWALLAQAGIRLDERHRIPAGAEPVPVVAGRQWAAECQEDAMTSGSQAAQWQPEAAPAEQVLRDGR